MPPDLLTDSQPSNFLTSSSDSVYTLDMRKNENLPAWLAHNLALEQQIAAFVPGVTRWETVAHYHARMLAEENIVWDQAAQKWVQA